MDPAWKNQLYFGDNLDILRRYLKDETVDLIYLDPPFNSQASYNVLFKEQDGSQPAAQIEAFDDFWKWDTGTIAVYHEVLRDGPRRVADLLKSLHEFLSGNPMMAYLTMMAIRLVEMHRVLKPTGFLYLHCDPTASHYLKLVLDSVFGADCYLNEVSWRRTTTKGDYLQGAINYPRVRDVIFYYRKDSRVKGVFHQPFAPYDQEYLDAFYRHHDPDGRRYRLDNLAAPGAGTRGHPQYEFLGVTRYWRYNRERMQKLYEEGRVVQTGPGRVPAYKRYLDEMPGVALGDDWDDITAVQGSAKERLGYQTQKPEALLERIINASSNEGDLVLDPFCGCGTTVAVAERLHRRWIGIDVTHLAIGLMRTRLRDTFGPDLHPFEVIGEPRDLSGARELAHQNPHQFQYWALDLVGARPAGEPKKGADRGVDGVLYFSDDPSGAAKKLIISVKGGHVTRHQVGDLIAVMQREGAEMALFLSMDPPTAPMRQMAAEVGMYQPPGLQPPVPRVQVLTVEELLSGKTLELPVDANRTFQRAPRQFKAKPAAPQTPLDMEEDDPTDA